MAEFHTSTIRSAPSPTDDPDVFLRHVVWRLLKIVEDQQEQYRILAQERIYPPDDEQEEAARD